jgi:hypothetical protein
MVYKNFNDIVDKVSALIIYPSKGTSKLCEKEFVNEFCYHNYCICVQCLYFHPLGGVIGSYQNVLVFYILAYGFD